MTASESEREALITETKIMRAHASLTAKNLWYTWRQKSVADDLNFANDFHADISDVSSALKLLVAGGPCTDRALLC